MAPDIPAMPMSLSDDTGKLCLFLVSSFLAPGSCTPIPCPLVQWQLLVFQEQWKDSVRDIANISLAWAQRIHLVFFHYI